MQIDVSQLEIGDEFLYAMQGTVVRAKVIRPVQQKKVQPKYNYQPAKVFYKSVKCNVAMKETTYTANWGNGTPRTWTKKEYCASDEYNTEKFVDLNWRNIWLIKKQNL
jgi:hypothetical protein